MRLKDFKKQIQKTIQTLRYGSPLNSDPREGAGTLEFLKKNRALVDPYKESREAHKPKRIRRNPKTRQHNPTPPSKKIAFSYLSAKRQYSHLGTRIRQVVPGHNGIRSHRVPPPLPKNRHC